MILDTGMNVIGDMMRLFTVMDMVTDMDIPLVDLEDLDLGTATLQVTVKDHHTVMDLPQSMMPTDTLQSLEMSQHLAKVRHR